jgi:hypothetical protein
MVAASRISIANSDRYVGIVAPARQNADLV